MHFVGQNTFFRVPAVIFHIAETVVVVADAGIHGNGQAVKRLHQLYLRITKHVGVVPIVVAVVAARHDKRNSRTAVDYVLHRFYGVYRIAEFVDAVVFIRDENEIQRCAESVYFRDLTVVVVCEI